MALPPSALTRKGIFSPCGGSDHRIRMSRKGVKAIPKGAGFLASVILLLALPPGGQAQAGAPEPYWQTLWREAESANLALRRARAELERQRALLEGVKASFRPKLQLSSTYQMRDGERPAYSLALSLLKSLSLSDEEEVSLALAALRVAQKEAELEETRRNLFLQLARAYNGYVAAARRASRLEEVIRLRELLLQSQRRRFELGLISEMDLSRAEQELLSSRASLSSARAEIESIRLQLREICGVEVPPGVSADYPDLAPISEDLSGLEAKVAKRPDVRRAELEVAIKELTLRQASVSNSPVLSLSGGGRRLTGKKDELFLSLGLTFDLVDFGRERSSIEAARADLEASRLRLQESISSAKSSILSDLASLRAAEENLKSLEGMVDYYRRRYELELRKRELGLSSWDDVHDALKLYQEAASNLERGRLDLENLRLSLWWKLGGKLP